MRRFLTFAAIWLTAAGCGTTPSGSEPDAADAQAQDVAQALDIASDVTASDASAADAAAPLANPYGNPDCDPIHPARCGMPWPSSLYLQPDASRKTGYRLQFGKTTLPPAGSGTGVDPKPYARLDGYSIGTSLLMQWPHLDTANLADEGHVEKSVLPDAAIVWLEIGSDGKVARHIPYFAELDGQEPDPALKTLYVRPGVILKPATRYVVAVRGLKAKDGKVLAASPAFLALRDGKTAGTILALRQPRFDEVFALLATEAVAKADLQLAWDFVTKSDEADHAALLKMRADAFAATGPLGPELTVKQVKQHTVEEDADIAMEVTGTMRVPVFVEAATVNGASVQLLHRGADGLPVQTGWEDREWYCTVPRSAIGGPAHALMQYGHGLNGHADEVSSGYLGKIANQNGVIPYAAHMRGMSQFDGASIIAILFDMDQFPTMSEKLHQGMIEWLLLQRAMRERFGDLAAVKGVVKIDKKQMYYFGNSQGGIFGGTVVALSQDVTRADLGVPGSNYSLLLQRSADFDGFFQILRGVYPDTRDQAILLLTIQLLWDSVDPVTHYRHLNVEPYPDTPVHHVLMDPAQGDHQVAVVTNEIVARSGVGIEMMAGWGKDVALVKPHAFPYVGSGIVLWDFGNAWPQPGNLPPVIEDAGPCAANDKCPQYFKCVAVDTSSNPPHHCYRQDPHELPRRSEAHTQQMIHFFHTGEIIDVCGGDGCHPD